MSASPNGSGWRRPTDALASENDRAGDGAGIVLRLAQRDSAALVDLHQLFGAPLFSYALRILDDYGDAEEALQDTFVRVWEKAEEFDASKGRPFTWCCTILRGFCLDRLRRNKAQKRGSGKIIPLDAGIVAETHASNVSDASTQAIWHEQIRHVHRALETLHPLERRYIEQSIFRGTTHHEIADQGGEPLGTVKSRIRRGMIKLRKFLRTHPNSSS